MPRGRFAGHAGFGKSTRERMSINTKGTAVHAAYDSVDYVMPGFGERARVASSMGYSVDHDSNYSEVYTKKFSVSCDPRTLTAVLRINYNDANVETEVRNDSGVVVFEDASPVSDMAMDRMESGDSKGIDSILEKGIKAVDSAVSAIIEACDFLTLATRTL